MRNLELNDKIIEYVSSVMGTTVGRGECWDLAQEALDRNLADWSRPTNFGRLRNPEIDEIKPGDIIQFRSLKITERLPGGVTKWLTLGAPDHTAVVYKVQGRKRYSVAHQNVGGMRRVITADVDLTKVTGGHIQNLSSSSVDDPAVTDRCGIRWELLCEPCYQTESVSFRDAQVKIILRGDTALSVCESAHARP
jgi:hypothetical protein